MNYKFETIFYISWFYNKNFINKYNSSKFIINEADKIFFKEQYRFIQKIEYSIDLYKSIYDYYGIYNYIKSKLFIIKFY
jgi:hypothetical protein